MKVTLIYGNEGSGKSSLFHSMCRSKKENNQKTMVIVPDQYTHQTELDLISSFGTNGLTDTEVLSFKRLSHRLKLIYGGASVIVMNEEGKSMIIDRIVNKMKGVGEGSLISDAFATDISSDIAHLIARFKQYGITPEMLETCGIDEEKYKRTATKLKEITDIYKAYSEVETVIDGRQYIDAEDDTALLCSNIAGSGLFADMNVYIDGFDDFTMTDLKVLEALIRSSESVTIVLPVDCTVRNDRKFLFRRQLTMVKNVEKILEECGITPERIRFADNGTPCPDGYKMFEAKKRNNAAIDFIEKNVFSIGNIDGKCEGNVFLYKELSPKAEAEHTADRILRLVREKGVRFNETAVVVSDTESYCAYLKKAFEKRSIPYFMDVKRNISDNSLVRFVISSVEAATERRSAGRLISFLKNGLLIGSEADMFSYREVAYLEKYCNNYFTGSKEWENGFTAGGEHYDLSRLNATREKILSYILPLEKALKNALTAKEMSKAVENYLEEFGVGDIVAKKIDALNEEGEIDIALEYSNINNVVRETLVQINTFLDDAVISAEEFTDILKNTFNNTEINVIPACIDQVLVVPSGRTMAKHIKALFVVGANGISVGEESGIFSMAELDVLKALDIDIGADRDKMLSDEEYYIYKTLSKPTDYLYVTFVPTSDELTSKDNAILINAMKRCMGITDEKDNVVKTVPYPYRLSECDNAGALTDAMLYRKTMQTEKTPAFCKLDSWLKENTNEKYRLLSDITDKGLDYELTTSQMPDSIMMKQQSGEYVVDISRLQKYMDCPYAYFVRYCLKPEMKFTGKVSEIDVGNLVHEILDRFTKTLSKPENIYDGYAEKFLDDNFDDIVSEYETGKFKATNENMYLLGRIRSFVLNMLKAMLEQRKVSSTVLFATELPFDDGAVSEYHIPSVKAKTKDGTGFKIRGKIDCAEFLETPDRKYWIVNDYKTGRTIPDNASIIKGKKLQLPIYSYALGQYDKDSYPGAMFYVNVNDSLKKDGKKESAEMLAAKRFGKVGLAADDSELCRGIDSGCGSDDGVHYDLKRSDIIADKSCFKALPPEELKAVSENAVNVAADVFDDMRNGYITKHPADATKCGFCEYRRFCGYDSALKNTDMRAADYGNDGQTEDEE